MSLQPYAAQLAGAGVVEVAVVEVPVVKVAVVEVAVVEVAVVMAVVEVAVVVPVVVAVVVWIWRPAEGEVMAAVGAEQSGCRSIPCTGSEVSAPLPSLRMFSPNHSMPGSSTRPSFRISM
mmetsp:Transcript_121537/g.259452  ORF Transcript_121537/g.259452 Transcript_121537/m.259452 type:complete len:120 (-) Transcript_121537:42-401(-)